MTRTISVPPRPALVARLADGRSVTIRPLTHDDAGALTAALSAADPADLRRRFMGSPPPLSFLVRHLDATDGWHALAIGAVDDAGRLVGVAQWDRDGDGATAELAVEVDSGWQRCGLGAALLAQVAATARERGIRYLTATYFADNLAIRRLLRATGWAVTTWLEQGEGYAVADLDPPPSG